LLFAVRLTARSRADAPISGARLFGVGGGAPLNADVEPLSNSRDPMGLFSTIKDKLTKQLLGELVVDLGTLPLDKLGSELSIEIRRRAGGPPHLQMKLTRTDEVGYFQIPCSREWAHQFDKVAKEIRRQLDAPMSPGAQ
jgi:hypothetical protein